MLVYRSFSLTQNLRSKKLQLKPDLQWISCIWEEGLRSTAGISWSGVDLDVCMRAIVQQWGYTPLFSHQRTISLSCSSRSSKWFMAWLGIFGLKIGQEKQFCPKPQACFSSADYLCHTLVYRSLLYTYCTNPLCPSEESLSAVYLSLAWWGFGGFCWRWWCYICCMCHWVPAVSFSDYMSIEEYFEEDEEPPLLLSSCLPDRKFQTLH